MGLADTEPELELVTEKIDTEFKHDRHTVKRQPYIKKTLKIDYNNKTFLSYEKKRVKAAFYFRLTRTSFYFNSRYRTSLINKLGLC